METCIKKTLFWGKNVILCQVFETIWTRARTCQNGHAMPLEWMDIRGRKNPGKELEHSLP